MALDFKMGNLGKRTRTSNFKIGGSQSNPMQSLENAMSLAVFKQMMDQQGIAPEMQAKKEAEKPYIQEEMEMKSKLGGREHLMKKASEDVMKLSQSYKFIDSLEKDYRDAYAGKNIPSGLKGGGEALKEYGSGVLLRKNEALRRYVRNREASGVALGRFSGDVGNFAWQEQQAHLKRLPLATPNLKLENMFLPDDPEYGTSLLANVKEIYFNKLMEAIEVARTGELPEGSEYKNWLQSQSEQTGTNTPAQSNTQTQDIAQQYNMLRSQGMSAEEAKARLGL
jgi:hypothetical protein